MAVHPKDGKLLYHLTRLDNLPSILTHGLRSRAQLRADGTPFADLADAEILARRGVHGLDAFVPFHFFPKNPFDCRVANEQAGSPLLVITVTRTTAAAQGWLVVPRHPLALEAPEMLEWAAGLAAIDWDRMTPGTRDYQDRACKLTCMAEALCRDVVRPDDFRALYTQDDASARWARSVAAGRIRASVDVAPWAFQRPQ